MDTFAITEGIVPENNNQDGHDAERASSEQQLPEEANKFQRAIAAWRSTSSFDALPILILIGADISTLIRHRLDLNCRKTRRYGFGYCRSTARCTYTEKGSSSEDKGLSKIR
jgi:hypothetical protein